jgi:two-component system NtrC family sensor kinase
MGRGRKPAKGKAKPAVPREARTNEDARVGELEKRLAEALRDKAEAQEQLHTRDRELVEAQDQQAATSEILKVIRRSPSDVQPVFDAVATSTARLCEALDAAIFRRDGDRLRLVAHHGPIPIGPIGEFTFPLVRGTFNGRAVLDGRPVHVADVHIEFPVGGELARRESWKALLCVPLMREGVALGSIALRRIAAERFTERQVALLQTFADQAVIAIENVRVFNETKEALDRQTATSEILRVISQSPTDVRKEPTLNGIHRDLTKQELTRKLVYRIN